MTALRTDGLERSPATGERWGVAAILALTLAAYAQTLASSFHFDDYAIFADPVLTSPGGWWRVFRLAQTRPLTYFTFWLNYRIGAAAPWGYHAVNLAIHVAALLVAGSVFRRLLKPWGALAATAIFALHPLQSEAVAYVFARATLLATLFCLLAWRDWLDRRAWRAAAWFVLGLLAKEECVAFPIFLLGVDWLLGRWRNRAWPPLAAMLAAAAAAGARLLYVAAHTSGAGIAHVQGISRWTYLLTQPKVICEYLLLFVCPIGQNFDHDIRVFTGWDWSSLAAPVTLAALLAVAVWQRRTWGVWLLGALGLLAPSSSVIPLADLMFEHRMYLPLMSLSVAAAWALQKLPRPVVALLPLALAVATGVRARIWSSEENLWADAAAKSPRKVRPKLQLARAVAQSNPERALALLQDARRIDPSNPEIFTQTGTLLLDQRDPYGALAEFDEALRREPRSPDAHSNRGTALLLLGRLGEAEAEFLEALRLDPCHANARHNLVLLCQARGESERLRAFETPPAGCSQ